MSGREMIPHEFPGKIFKWHIIEGDRDFLVKFITKRYHIDRKNHIEPKINMTNEMLYKYLRNLGNDGSTTKKKYQIKRKPFPFPHKTTKKYQGR